jgi:hypothetical protein
VTGPGAVPARPDAGGVIRPGNRWLPTFVVLAVIAVTVLGGFVVAAALPASEASSIRIGSVVRVRPAPGWSLARHERASIPSSAGSVPADIAELTRGSGALDVVALPGAGASLDELALFYRDDVLASQLQRLTVSSELERITLPSGLLAGRFAYIGTSPESGAAIEGTVVVVAVASSGSGAVFDGWAPEGQLRLVSDEIETMIETAEIG